MKLRVLKGLSCCDDGGYFVQILNSHVKSTKQMSV